MRGRTGRAALLELVPNARTRALENPRATSMGRRLVMNQNATGRITIPNIISPARSKQPSSHYLPWYTHFCASQMSVQLDTAAM